MSNPSLILPQSPAYGEDYVYAAQVYDGEVPVYDVLPLTFTRASGGSRINKDGLVQNMPYNLVEYSEQFDNAYWNKYQSSITANSIANPINGQTTADQVVYTTTGTAVLYTTSSALANQVYALSCYGKKGTTNILQIGFTLGTGDKIANFNLNTGVITTTSSGVTANIESVGNGWYRCTMSLTPDINTPNIFVNSTSGTTGEYIYIFGGQLNIGSTAQPYLATTDRLNMPRITYPVGGGCGALLLEKQSTNRMLYSEQFENVNWSKYNAAITANVITSPDGTQNADRYVDSTTNNTHNVYASFTISGDTTISIYVKSGEYTRFAISNLSDGGDVLFNLSTVAVISTSANFQNGKIESVGNGWYRVSATTNGVSGGKAMGYGLVNDAGAVSFAGTGTKGVYIWGAQLENSSYATSYISTTSASSTRIADACYKAGISNLIGGGTGTWYMDFEMMQGTGTSNPFAFDLSDGSTANRLYLYWNESAQSWYWGGADTGITLPSTLHKKIAIKFSGTTAKLFCNGSSIATNTISSAFNRLDFGNRFSQTFPMDGKINEAYFYPTSLTDAECISLTTI